MAYDEELAERAWQVVEDRAPAAVRMKMFGGVAFMVDGHMACGVIGEDLMVRVGAHAHESALDAGAGPMEFTGRTMRGMVVVPADALHADDTLTGWVEQGMAFARSLPPKLPKPARSARSAKA